MTSKKLRRSCLLLTSALAGGVCLRFANTANAADQPAAQDNQPAAPPAAAAQSADESNGPDQLQTVIVTGTTSKRTLLNASLAITSVSADDLVQKAPRTTVDVLEMIPGIFVEGTAGPVSNNYSVRGLPGGGQEFIRLEEDGMPAIYGGLNDDEVFQYDTSPSTTSKGSRAAAPAFSHPTPPAPRSTSSRAS